MSAMARILYRTLDPHVSVSNRQLIAYVRKRYRGDYQRGPQYRELRKKMYREVIAIHKRAREIYKMVTG